MYVNLKNFASDDPSREATIAARRHAIDQARRADSNDPDTLIQLNWLLATDGDSDAAQNSLRRAVVLAPNNADVLAVASIAGGTSCTAVEEPLDWAGRAQRLNPNAPHWYHMGMGIASLYASRFAAAIEAFTKAPDIPVRWYHSAAAHALADDRDGARRAVKRLLELNPMASASRIAADRGEWGNPKARALFLEGARLAGMPE